jgi:hypothetical protein
MAPRSEFDGRKGPFVTLETTKPAGGKRRLFVVTGPDGKAHYTWADGSGSALIYVAREKKRCTNESQGKEKGSGVDSRPLSRPGRYRT